MEIKKHESDKEKYILQLGDIIEMPGEFGIVVYNRIEENFTIRSLETDLIISLCYSTLSDLTEHISFPVYSKDDYELKLVKKTFIF